MEEPRLNDRRNWPVDLLILALILSYVPGALYRIRHPLQEPRPTEQVEASTARPTIVAENQVYGDLAKDPEAAWAFAPVVAEGDIAPTPIASATRTKRPTLKVHRH
jgi:hypothetical protein